MVKTDKGRAAGSGGQHGSPTVLEAHLQSFLWLGQSTACWAAEAMEPSPLAVCVSVPAWMVASQGTVCPRAPLPNSNGLLICIPGGSVPLPARAVHGTPTWPREHSDPCSWSTSTFHPPLPPCSCPANAWQFPEYEGASARKGLVSRGVSVVSPHFIRNHLL